MNSRGEDMSSKKLRRRSRLWALGAALLTACSTGMMADAGPEEATGAVKAQITRQHEFPLDPWGQKMDGTEPRPKKPSCPAGMAARLRAVDDERSVTLDCSLQLESGAPIRKRIILAGEGSSGVVLDCGGVLLDGDVGTPNAGKDMIEIHSTGRDEEWSRPTDITIRNCKIKGSMRIYGRGPNGEADEVRKSSRRDANHPSRLRSSAPTRVRLENISITAIKRTPLYVGPGVTHVMMTDSDIGGDAIRTALYLDTESAYNTFRDNSFYVKIFDEYPWGENRIGPQISIDGSSRNRFINNRLSGLNGGGFFLFRNCGEGGTVRHTAPVHNQFINNVFYYNQYDGFQPSVYLGRPSDHFFDIGFCDEDDGYPWGSSASNDPHAQHNVVMQNQIYKRNHEEMIREGPALTNRPNYVAHNETVETRIKRPAGCYVSEGLRTFIWHGQSTDVFLSPSGLPRCTGLRATCQDGDLVWSEDNSCSLVQVPFSCQVSGNNDGCSEQVSCGPGQRIVGVKAACNLESGSVSDAEMADVSINMLKVIRPSDSVLSGVCRVASTAVMQRAGDISNVLGRMSVPVFCREHDENGGDCHIRGVLFCK